MSGMTTHPSNITATESFPPDVCPTCGYSVNGLPARGVCPECGASYYDTQLILYGWACGRHATTNNSRGLRFLVGLAPLYLAWQLFLPMATPWRIAVVTSWVGSIGLSLMRRKKTDLPGRIQIRMNRDGIRQIDDVTTLRGPDPDLILTPWHKLEIATLQRRSNGRIPIRIKHVGMPWYVMVSNAYPVDAEIQSGRLSLQMLTDIIAGLRQRRLQANDRN
jgi:hypothetical protein